VLEVRWLKVNVYGRHVDVDNTLSYVAKANLGH
jgi:hypothetical protein